MPRFVPRWMRAEPSSIKNWIPQRLTTWLRGPAGAALGMLLVGGLAFGLGRSLGLGAADAQQTQKVVATAISIDDYEKNRHLYPDDMSGRVVAYIYGNIPVTRVELAEYLIARFGQERLKFLVNRKIIDKACHVMGITVTDTEVDLHFAKELKALGTTADVFDKTILKKYNKSIFEWKEDVIRPKLAVQKMIERERVEVTDAEVFKLYEMRYGPKVQCRMIVYREKQSASAAWQKFRESPSLASTFLAEASNQFIKELCPEAGKVPAIHKHFTSKELELAAFNLKKGDISNVIEMPDRHAIILFCDEHIGPDVNTSYDRERPKLLSEMIEQKKTQMMQERVAKLVRDAAPRYVFAKSNHDQFIREVQDELGAADPLSFKKTTP